MTSTLQSDENITIVCVTDNHYIVLLAALLKSIEVNHQSPELIDFYIVGDRLSNSNIDKLNRSSVSNKITIHWLKMNEVIPAGFQLPADKSSYPLNIYIRLFIPYFLPKAIVKILYLDVDMLVLKDISLLWHIKLNGHIIAAAKDLLETVSNPFGGIQNYKSLGIKKDSKYFNTGLLLIDRQLWEQADITRKVLKCVQSNKQFASLPDQYGLNIVLYKKWLEIESKWNSYANLNDNDPFIIHFIHRKPIYSSYDNNEGYKELFYQYLANTAWKGYKSIGEPRRYLKKLFNVFEKVVLKF